jgi:hypothetical protein
MPDFLLLNGLVIWVRVSQGSEEKRKDAKNVRWTYGYMSAGEHFLERVKWRCANIAVHHTHSAKREHDNGGLFMLSERFLHL